MTGNEVFKSRGAKDSAAALELTGSHSPKRT